MGDNRDRSLDSRTFGPVAEDRVIGVVTAVLFPRTAHCGGGGSGKRCDEG